MHKWGQVVVSKSLLNEACTHVGVEHLGGEPDTGGLVWIAVAEGYPQAVDATFPRGVLRSHDRCCPHIHVVLRERGGAAALWRVALDGFQVAHEPEAAGWHGAGHWSYHDEPLTTGGWPRLMHRLLRCTTKEAGPGYDAPTSDTSKLCNSRLDQHSVYVCVASVHDNHAKATPTGIVRWNCML